MRSLVLTLSCLVLMNSQAAAPQSTADENFLGYIGPTTDAEWEATPTLTLEMPKPPSNTVEFGQNGKIELVMFETDKFGVYGTGDPAIDGKIYSESKAMNILKVHNTPSALPMQLTVSRDVETKTMLQIYQYCKTISTEVSLQILL